MKLQSIIDLLYSVTGWRIFAVAVIAYLVFGAYIMPHGLMRIQELSGKKVEVMDLQYTYTPERAREIISAYTDESRAYAAQFNLIADSAYPVVYTFLFLIMMAGLFRAISAYGWHAGYLHLLPLPVMLADYCENSCIIRMMHSYPNFSDGLVRLSSACTTIKWSLLGLEVLLIIGALGILAYHRMKKSEN